ncbi:MAG TPA: hypothetical protein VHB47_25750 [Thermoanaerobaculia bacterium]|nr:hypothetical protein [Thermoanaerobaculia bacterium]
MGLQSLMGGKQMTIGEPVHQEGHDLAARSGEPVTALVARLASHDVAVDAHATVPDWWG